MAHVHDEDQSTYYLEQLCTVAVCGIVGAVCVLLWLYSYVWPPSKGPSMLTLMLVPGFHLPVLLGGIALLILAAVRGLAVWTSARRPAHSHEHGQACCHDDHDHGHDHDCCHDHQHDHEHVVMADHDHAHAHEHEHEHAVVAESAHSHAHLHGIGDEHVHDDAGFTETDAAHVHAHGPDCGHDHGWSPWRYAVLLLPVVLYFLSLPNKGLTIGSMDVDVEGGQTTIDKGQKIDLEFKELKQAAASSEAREYYEGKTGTLKGQYVPSAKDNLFSLVRMKMRCCAADAVPADVVIETDKPVTGFKPMEWIVVTGLIQFRMRANRSEYVPVLHVGPKGRIARTEPAADLYLQ